MSGQLGRLVVYGAGGHARVVAELAESLGYEVLGWLDEKIETGALRADRRVLGSVSWLRGLDAPTVVALGIGDNHIRAETYEAALAVGGLFPALVHPRATVSPSARLGAGCVVMAGAVINAGAQLEDGVVVNTGAVVEHDCHVGRFAHISPNATLTGGVKLGALSQLGAGATAAPGVTIGANTLVGAGAVVVKNLDSGVIAYGVPARVVRSRA